MEKNTSSMLQNFCSLEVRNDRGKIIVQDLLGYGEVMYAIAVMAYH